MQVNFQFFKIFLKEETGIAEWIKKYCKFGKFIDKLDTTNYNDGLVSER